MCSGKKSHKVAVKDCKTCNFSYIGRIQSLQQKLHNGRLTKSVYSFDFSVAKLTIVMEKKQNSCFVKYPFLGLYLFKSYAMVRKVFIYSITHSFQQPVLGGDQLPQLWLDDYINGYFRNDCRMWDEYTFILIMMPKCSTTYAKFSENFE